MNELAEWDIFIELALWMHQMSINRSMQLSPFMIIYGLQLQFSADHFQS